MTKYIKEKFEGNKDQIALYIAENIKVSDISYSSNLDDYQDTFKLGFRCDKNTFTLNRTSDDMLEITYNRPITLYTKLSTLVTSYLVEGEVKVRVYKRVSINHIIADSVGDKNHDRQIYMVDDKGRFEVIWTHKDGLI